MSNGEIKLFPFQQQALSRLAQAQARDIDSLARMIGYVFVWLEKSPALDRETLDEIMSMCYETLRVAGRLDVLETR